MPLNPQYVQRVSERTVPGGLPGMKPLTHKNFSNISSQMADPGALPRFFGKQNQAYPMPFTDGDIPVPQSPILQQLSENNNVSALPTKTTMPHFFKDQSASKQVRFRTQNMIALGVPLGMTELRATDASY